MECFPPCASCTGLCKTVVSPNRRDAADGSRVTPQLGAGTVTLVCGHYTNEKAQMVWREYRPKRGLRYCSTCFKWVKYVPVARPRKTRNAEPPREQLTLKESILGGPARNLVDEMEVIPF